MNTNKKQLERRFFAYLQSRKTKIVKTGDLLSPLGIDVSQERDLLSRLFRLGRIARVRRGLYLAPLLTSPVGKWSPSEALALATLMEDRRGHYQICGPNAFLRYGWSDQVPNRVYAYNNRISGDRRIGSVALTLIKVADRRLGAQDTVQTPEGIAMVYSNKARSLMDAVYDWWRFGSLPQAYGWIRAELGRDKRLAADLTEVSLRYANQGTLRRIGKLLEMEQAPQPFLNRIERALNPSKSWIPWIPNLAKKGSADRRWGVVLNDEQ